MKPKIKLATLALAFLSTLNAQLSTAHAQGSLTPPGAPAPTMKTLSQIEPRTPISSAPFTINVPGSYYLTANLSVSTGNAIAIATNGVTLDLNGFTITSTAAVATGTGIAINTGMRDLTIRNGFVQGGVTNNGSGVFSGSGFEYGVYGNPYNMRVTSVSVSGCLYYGIYIGGANSTVVESCTVRTVGGTGIRASIIKASEATDCADYGILDWTFRIAREKPTVAVPGYMASEPPRTAMVAAAAAAPECFPIRPKTARATAAVASDYLPPRPRTARAKV